MPRPLSESVRNRAVDLGWKVLAVTSRWVAGPDPVPVLRDVPYGAGPHRRLDVYAPGEGRPAALYIHGGGFRVLSKDTHWMMGRALAERGYTVFCVDYRLAPKHPYPAGLEDVAAAYAWVLEHAADHGADASRLLLAGESAGANLALGIALATCLSRPEPFARALYDLDRRPGCVGALCGLLEVGNIERYVDDPRVSPVARSRMRVIVEDYLPRGNAPFFADPLRALEDETTLDRPLPPVFASVGTADPLLDDTRRLERALSARGVEHEARYYTGGVHAFQAGTWTAQGRASWDDLVAFAGGAR
jgi:acetyl esterase